MCGSHDAPLSARGRAQTERLREHLERNAPAGALYSSTLVRAVETAAAAPAVLLPRLRKLRSLEEIHCGAVEGLPLERVQAEYADLWARNLLQEDDDFCWPGGESYAALRRRVLRAVRAIARLHRGERVVVVTHAGVISQILGWIHGRNAARWEEFRPGNASITQVISDGSSWVVESFNDRSHLR